MKKFIYLLAAATTLACVGCSKDNDVDLVPYPDTIAGTWEAYQAYWEEELVVDYGGNIEKMWNTYWYDYAKGEEIYTFGATGFILSRDYDNDISGTYTIYGNTLTLKIYEPSTADIEEKSLIVKSLSSKKLVLIDNKEIDNYYRREIYFKRIH